RTRALRACVRLLTPERRALVVMGLAGEAGAWPDGFAGTTFALDGQTAAGHAIRSNGHYYLDDLAQRDACCAPLPHASAVAAVLLRNGTHVIGVLSVDWPHANACTPPVRDCLESLAERYAVAITAFSTDDLFQELSRILASDPHGEVPPQTFSRFLQASAQLVGAEHGALFLRWPTTGRYHLEASLRHPEWSAEEHWYSPGEGVTG